MVWQVQEAKQRFSELVNRALAEGPQVVTRHGREVVIVLAADHFHQLAGGQEDFKDFLLSGPNLADLEIDRAGASRAVDL